MPDPSPTPVDLDAIETAMRYDSDWTTRHGRTTVHVLIAEIRRLRSRTSIGPDSERIRELEAETIQVPRGLFARLMSQHEIVSKQLYGSPENRFRICKACALSPEHCPAEAIRAELSRVKL